VSAPPPDAELRRAAANLEIVRAQMENLGRQEELLRITLEEISRARETLVRAKASSAGAELLMPIGANSFVFGTLRDADRVIVGIGTDVAIELPTDEAVTRLDARVKAIEEAERGLASRMQELSIAEEESAAKVQELYTKAQGEAPR
jgi:prefoldin alpha subunit